MKLIQVLGQSAIFAIATMLLLGVLHLVSSKERSEDRLLGAAALVSGMGMLSWRYAVPAIRGDRSE